MLVNNAERLKIVLSQKDRWDYAEFTLLCEGAGIVALPIPEWAQKVGMLTAAQACWPDGPEAQAYHRFVDELRVVAPAQLYVGTPRTSPQEQAVLYNRSGSKPFSSCKGCGGGAIV